MEPLASRMRPKNLGEFIGQERLVGEGMPLRVAIEEKKMFSFILWGPPGVGKTTLARIYADALGADFYELSAVSSGKKDVREIVGEKPVRTIKLRQKVLFLDEIHRFNKSQQDFLLPFVESGDLILIGATTENPSFEVNSALLSRCKVFVLNNLSLEEMFEIIIKASKILGVKIAKKTQEHLAMSADGDARQLITMIEMVYSLYGKITLDSVKNTLTSKHFKYDKRGEEHHNLISAFIKSMRASKTDAALYYLARMILSGEDPKFIARRMLIFASEDIGIAQPTALVVANAVFDAVERIGLPECGIHLSHGVVHLSRAQKSRDSYDAYKAVLADAEMFGNASIPMKLRNAPSKLMEDLGYSEGYQMYEEGDDFLPEVLKGKKWFRGGKSN